MPKSKPSRILIVGAGPVGLTAAIELARRGFQPRIIDRASGPAGESRALGIHARTLEIFEPSGITEKLLAEGCQVRQAVFCDQQREFMRIDFSLTRQKYNFALMLPQSRTEQILLSALQSMGIHVEWNTSLEEIRQEMNAVDCRIQSGDGWESFEMVIGCDGAHSTVRESLSIGFAGASYEHDWHLVDVRLRCERPTDQLRIKMIGGEILAYFPMAADVGRFVFSGPNVVDVVGREVEIAELIWQSNFRISHRIVESYQRGSVFLAGDAAHVHSPVGGRGMNLGIEDAATLAWLTQTGQTDHYTQLRRPVGESVLRLTDAQTRQFTSKNPIVNFVTRRIAPIMMRSKTMQRFAFRRISGADTPRPEWLDGDDDAG